MRLALRTEPQREGCRIPSTSGSYLRVASIEIEVKQVDIIG